MLTATPAITAGAANIGPPVRHVSLPASKPGASRQPFRRPHQRLSPRVWPQAQSGSPGVGSEGPISPVAATDDFVGPAATFDPTNTFNVFVSASLLSVAPHIVGFTNAATGFWEPVDLPPPDQPPNDYAYGTAVAYDNHGELYDAYMALHFVNAAGDAQTQLVVTKSTDKGLDWYHPVRIDGPTDAPGKPTIAVDRSSGPHSNRIYVAYDAGPTSTSHPILLSHSDNGLIWSTPIVVADGFNFGVNAMVDAQGSLFLTWSACLSTTACDPNGVAQVLLAKSIDGGNSFQPPVVVSQTTTGLNGSALANYGPAGGCNPPATVQPTPAVDIDGSGRAHGGTLYAVWSDQRTNSPMHVYLRSSPDGGTTWNPPMQLDAGNPNDAWHATVSVDQATGIVTAAWYDRRDDASNTAYRLYYAQSDDGGKTFTQPMAVASATSSPQVTCLGTGQGIQMLSRGGGAEPFWVDTRNGAQEIFGAMVDERAVAQAAMGVPLAFKTATYPTTQTPESVLRGDFNGDGKPDLAVATSAGIEIFLNNGDGTFGAPVITAMNLSSPAIRAGDFNGDGKLDLAVASHNGLWILLGKGDGTFQPPARVTGSATPAGLVIGDFNEDGKLDIATVDPTTSPTLALFLGQGDGTFALAPNAFYSGGAPQCYSSIVGAAVAAGRFTGAHLDLAFTSSCQTIGTSSWDGLINVVPGHGDGTFGPAYLIGAGSSQSPPRDIAAGRIMGTSSYEDLAVIEGNSDQVFALLSRGGGTFARGPTVTVGHFPDAIAIADINGDGLADLVVANRDSNTITILLGAGDGSFSGARDFATGTNPIRLAVGDLNSDGVPDVVVGNGYSDNSLTVYLTRGLTLSPPSIDFGKVTVGTSSAPQTITVTNNTSAAVRIPLTTVRATDFSETADSCAGTTLAVGASCSVSVKFTPMTSGARAASLELIADASGSPQTALLSATGVASPRTFYEARGLDQYQLVAGDGSTWTDMDTSGLSITLTPPADSFAVIGANADLWTITPGVNQDIGINVDGAIVAWKESGGFAGTYSPNAAFVQAVVPVMKDHNTLIKLVWKTNKDAITSTIYAGAGSLDHFSPTRLTVQLLPAAQVSTVKIIGQPRMAANDGSSTAWTDIDPGLHVNLQPTVATTAILGGNADLWTARPGFNQDIGIFVSGGRYGSTPQLVAWKESGGFAGTYSPNAAFVQAGISLDANIPYTVSLRWKANKPVPANTIFSGAGPVGLEFSPTTLSALLVPEQWASSTGQFTHAASSNDQDWQPLGAISLPLGPVAGNSLAILGGNVDLWTTQAGYNQDVAIFVSDSSGPLQLLAWKESGGFAGTYSPNAAFVQAVLPLAAGHTYTISLMWKANKPVPAGTIYAGAGPLAGEYSPTSLSAQVVPG